MKRTTFLVALMLQVLCATTIFAKDNLVVAGQRMTATCGSLTFAIEAYPSSGVRVSRLNAGSGIDGQKMPLFEITIRSASGERQTLRSDAGWQQASLRRSDSQTCLVKLSRSLPSPGGELTMTVMVRLDGADGQEPCLSFSWDDCQVPSGWTLEYTTLLPLCFGSLPEGARFFYPYCSGILCDPTTESLEWNISYPSGFGASMGWYALYGPEGGIYYAAHDPEATVKQLYMKATPSSGIEMRFNYPATTRQGGQAEPAEAHIVLAPLQGDWFDAAVRYRSWVRSEANWYPRDKMGPQGRTDTPQWMKGLSLWVQGGPSVVKTFQRTMGVPMGLHWYNWHKIPFDNDYPHYFPANDGFRTTIADLQASNIYVMPYINGRLWDTRDSGLRDSLFTSMARPAVTKHVDGTIITEKYGSKESDGSDVTLGVMCPQSEVWRSKMKEVVLRLCNPDAQEGEGTKGVYMDQIAAAPPVSCFDATHGHPLGGGSWWTSAYRGMLENIRATKPADVILTTESNADGYVDLFDGFLVWQFSHNNQVPAFAAVYGGSIQLFGRTYASTTPIDFKMSLAQAFVWGEQLGWFNANPFLTSLQFTTSIAPFLRRAVWLREQFSHYFYMGEMARPPKLVGENPELTGQMSFTGSLRPVKNPAVMCGAWTIPSQQRTLLLFANYSTDEVSLGLSCPLAEWGYKEGRYVVTRYDSSGSGTRLGSLPSEITFRANEAFVLEITPYDPSSVHVERNISESPVEYFDLSGRPTSTNHRGLRVKRGKKVSYVR